MLHETQFHRASNWTVYALQTEEENPAGADSFSVQLQNVHHILFANLFMYRVSRNVKPKLNAIESADSSAILFDNVHNFSQTRLAFDNTISDSTSGRPHPQPGLHQLRPHTRCPPGCASAFAVCLRGRRKT